MRKRRRKRWRRWSGARMKEIGWKRIEYKRKKDKNETKRQK